MAGDWIKWVKGLATRPEIVRIASALRTDRRRTACACMELWEWADSVTIDGDVQGVTPEFIDEYIGISGFFSAMEASGWVSQIPNGIRFTNFTRHNGESAKRRALDADRKQAAREHVRKMSASQADKERTREEKRREEKKQQQQEETPSGAAAPAADSLRDWATQQAKRPEWLPSGKPWITAKTWYMLGTRIARSQKVTLADYEAIVREARDSRNTLKNPAAFIVKRLDEMTKEMEQ